MLEKSPKTWTLLKQDVNIHKHHLRYEENIDDFYIWVEDGNREYYTTILKDEQNADYLEFINTYKPIADRPHRPVSDDGKEIVRAESRPLGHTALFTCKADSESGIGDGKLIAWDFSNEDDLIDVPSGSNYKRKRIEFGFIDDVYLKDGAFYYHNTKKGSYGDFYIVCPAGQYYIKNDGTPALATEDTVVVHYVNSQFMYGSVPMGDELNTECCSDKIPNNYIVRLEITVPDDDNESFGWVSLELFRKRTVIL